MAKPATKKAPKADAPKAKAPATPAARAAPRTAAAPARSADSKAAATATIKISKEKHGGTVRGAVNGQRFELPVGSDVQVTAAQLEALNASHVEYEVVTPLPNGSEDAAEGSAASSTLTGTANRLEPANPTPPVDGDGNPLPTPELRQITDEELKSASQEEGAAQAEEKADA
jgi:hypothetical protein